jgi:hypothetical protein
MNPEVKRKWIDALKATPEDSYKFVTPGKWSIEVIQLGGELEKKVFVITHGSLFDLAKMVSQGRPDCVVRVVLLSDVRRIYFDGVITRDFPHMSRRDDPVTAEQHRQWSEAFAE